MIPELQIVIAGDNDIKTEGNPGRTKAEDAAKAHGLAVTLPRTNGDFNDLVSRDGKSLQEVQEQLEKTYRPDREDPRKKEQPDIQLVTLGEIHRMEAEFPHPVIDGLLEKCDSLLLTGPSGLGKSLTVDAISISVASGNMLFNQFNIPAPQAVLQIQSENSLKARKQRITAVLDSYKGTPLYDEIIQALDRIVTTMVGMDCRMSGDLLDPDFGKMLLDMIQAVDAGLLIIDPLISFHLMHENDNVGMRTVLDRLTEITSQAGAAVLAVHHHGKGEHQGANQSRGASAIIDWARGILTLNKQPHEHRLLIRVEHTKHGNFKKANSFLLEVDGPRVLATEPDIVCPPSKVAEILSDLGGSVDSKNQLTKALMKTCEISRRTAQDAIEQASKYGFIEAIHGKHNAFEYQIKA